MLLVHLVLLWGAAIAGTLLTLKRVLKRSRERLLSQESKIVIMRAPIYSLAPSFMTGIICLLLLVFSPAILGESPGDGFSAIIIVGPLWILGYMAFMWFISYVVGSYAYYSRSALTGTSRFKIFALHFLMLPTLLIVIWGIVYVVSIY